MKSCIKIKFLGMRLGMMQIKVGIIHFISKYEVLPCQETPIPMEFDNYTVFTKSRNNMKLNLRRLKTNNL
jgi:cytochrome P450 family 6